MDLCFLSSNKYKIDEVSAILNSSKINVIAVSKKINEIQSNNMEEIATDKVLKAFEKLGRPIMVEQTGLLLKDFCDLPGGLTQVFWDSLQADNFSKYFSNTQTAAVVAKTVIAFCDGKQIRIFEGEVSGRIVSPPRGNREFQWDCVFQPDGYDETFAEMGEKKNSISMRMLALKKFSHYLEAIT
jgi:XTP/dITP diphosphohydrolase